MGDFNLYMMDKIHYCTMIEGCDTCHLIVGSVNSTGTIRNPWTYTERYCAINREYPNVKISPVNDTLYHDEWWVAAIIGFN